MVPLKSIPHSMVKVIPPSVIAALEEAGWILYHAFLGSKDPVIKYRCDRKGEHWQVYDPVTDQVFHFASKADVNVWLEERYHSRRH